MRRVLVLAFTMLVVTNDAAATDDAGVRDAGAGKLAPDVIRTVVRASLDEFKRCFAKGLHKNPNLRGRVNTRFVIDGTGHVSSASDEPTSDLPDLEVRKCIADKFRALEFPNPEHGGSVTVIYPLVLSGDMTDAGP
jgi:hypothetical protein